MELLSKLGIDWRLLIAQIVNFLILLGLLSYFLYKPLLNLLETRRKTIEEGLEKAKRAEQEFQTMTKRREEALAKTQREAMDLLEQAKKEAGQKRAALLEQAKQEVERMITEGKEQLAAEQQRMLKEARAHLAEMVAMATERTLKETAFKVDKELIEKSLRELKV